MKAVAGRSWPSKQKEVGMCGSRGWWKGWVWGCQDYKITLISL